MTNSAGLIAIVKSRLVVITHVCGYSSELVLCHSCPNIAPQLLVCHRRESESHFSISLQTGPYCSRDTTYAIRIILYVYEIEYWCSHPSWWWPDDARHGVTSRVTSRDEPAVTVVLHCCFKEHVMSRCLLPTKCTFRRWWAQGCLHNSLFHSIIDCLLRYVTASPPHSSATSH